MKELKTKTTECKKCKVKMVERTMEVISDDCVDKFELKEGLYCSECGAFHGEGFVQYSYKVNKFGYKKTLDVNTKNMN